MSAGSTSLTLVVPATVLLLLVVVPAEAAVLRRLEEPAGTADVRSLVMRIRADAGTDALVWAVILVLMVSTP